MQYYFKTPFGIFFISPAPYGGYNLKLEEDVINWSEKVEDLVQQVHEKTSGFEPWDNQQKHTSPKTSEEWQIKIQ